MMKAPMVIGLSYYINQPQMAMPVTTIAVNTCRGSQCLPSSISSNSPALRKKATSVKIVAQILMYIIISR